MAAKLPQDCLRQILAECHVNDVPLYNYLFVNWSWCECVTPLIWQKPFERKDGTVFREEKSFQFIRTLITCLPDDSKEFLHENDIQLPHNNRKIQTFDYPAFIQKLEPQRLRWATREWIDRLAQTSPTTTPIIDENKQLLNRKNFILLQEILKLLIRRGKRLSKFVLSETSTAYDDGVNIPFYLLPNAQTFMEQLRLLVCVFPHEVPDSTFYSLAQSATNIEAFDISVRDESEGLIQLIRNQRGIKELTLSGDRLNHKFDEALKAHTPTITHIECFETLSISPDTLIQCRNLRVLNLYCKIPENTFIILGNAQFPFLTKLDIQLRNKLDLERLSRIIQTTTGRMKVLKLHWDTFDPENTYTLIKAIGDYCPRIVELVIPIKSEDASGLAFLLSKCCHIRSIMLISKADIVQDGEQLVIAIADNASAALRSCIICGRWNYTPEVWQTFCERQQSNSPPIRISLIDKIKLSPEITKILRDYTKSGRNILSTVETPQHVPSVLSDIFDSTRKLKVRKIRPLTIGTTGHNPTE
ncbi:8172_t:CDS:2 [Ambispora gerdemannii]|uniref:8172_t:CDS:1 n=1 Tax=Ambispora gerdemannii TaxID=144530 RepID=A0A9N9GRK1_9GLOM|nr:8172_t:CDS:2 [Ambispora gerdemannii]